MLPFAGLWDEWHDPKSGQQIRSCTIIILTDANAQTRPIHDRMPVILVGAQQTAWLASQTSSKVGRCYVFRKANRSALIVSAWVVGMPCGKPL